MHQRTQQSLYILLEAQQHRFIRPPTFFGKAEFSKNIKRRSGIFWSDALCATCQNMSIHITIIQPIHFEFVLGNTFLSANLK